jgi:hypothetical protein
MYIEGEAPYGEMLITTRTKALIIKVTRAQHRPTPVATATHAP